MWVCVYGGMGAGGKGVCMCVGGGDCVQCLAICSSQANELIPNNLLQYLQFLAKLFCCLTKKCISIWISCNGHTQNSSNW